MRLRLYSLALLASALFGAWVNPALATANSGCPVNYSYDPATKMCQPIYSRPVPGSGCNPYTPDGFLGCYGSDWE
ncbi:hypothetical protein MPRG_23850 [Mycobacterium paragordonae]|uniref:DUF3761 domain-containing protein n=1 Tax=Mycobacterium paragordonae TaxID=1389713 RepID=A0ABQ1C3X6_9MYCO|nr:hypothetical protein MPRG_23850 [Mycobacterium paragordonae]